ncbi:MAG: diguanylate cyclase [Steroidobacteraceae bacterium]
MSLPETILSLDWQLLQSVIDASPDGVVVCDACIPGWPVVYVNHAFERLSGYSKQEVVDRDWHLLQQDEGNDDALQKIRAALRQGVACHATLHNYRKNGSQFINDLQLVPLRDSQGNVSHFVSFHRLGNEAVSAVSEMTGDANLNTQRMLAHVCEDRQTGLLRRSYFEDLLRRDFSLAQREQRSLSILLFSIDGAAAYRDVFGVNGTELTFKRVARAIAGCFRRASDLCARWEDSQVVAATLSSDSKQAIQMGELVMGRVRDLAIHHPRAVGSRYLTISAGIVCAVPGVTDSVEEFISMAAHELRACNANQLILAAG